jgi:ribosomal protein S18 acetylase RimI-like enzyme
MTLAIARDTDVSRLWPALAASRIFSTPDDLAQFRADGPWRVLVDDDGRAAVLERWREHLDILAIKGVWCSERDLPQVIGDIRVVAREQGFGRIMSPLIAEGAVRPYALAGMETTETIVALRADARRIAEDPPPMPPGFDMCLGDPSEVRSLDVVDEQCFPPFWRYGQDSLRKMFDDGRLATASMSGQVIGYTWCTMDRGIGTLGRLAVLPEHRRHGVGGALLGDALRYMARNGAEVLSLCTQEDNAASRALYQRAGLRELPERLVFLVQEA